jgi:hypothetical protein
MKFFVGCKVLEFVSFRTVLGNPKWEVNQSTQVVIHHSLLLTINSISHTL